MHAPIITFIQNYLFLLTYPPTSNTQPLFLHDLLCPSRPRSGILFQGSLSWDFWGIPSVFIWHNKDVSADDCWHPFLCVFSPHFFKLHVHLHALAPTYSHRHIDLAQIKVKIFLQFLKNPSHLTEWLLIMLSNSPLDESWCDSKNLGNSDDQD